MRPGSAQYLTGARPPRRPFLRTARLNAVGWAALVVVCLLAGALAASLLGPTGWPGSLRAAIGPIMVLAALVAADRRKWSRTETGFSFSDDVAELRRVGDRLVEQGLPVRIDDHERGATLRYRNRDAKRVHAALCALGVRID